MWSTSEESIASVCQDLLLREASFVSISLVVVTALLAAVVWLFRKAWLRESGARRLCAKVCGRPRNRREPSGSSPTLQIS